MAAPRVFISSTYYDLKHVRNDIGDFIRSLGYTPVMHDRGGVAYTQTDTIENSCYSELTTCDIVICIIGNHFGTQASTGDFSITMEELRTAIKNKKKIYIFIAKDVYIENRTYMQNKAPLGPHMRITLKFISLLRNCVSQLKITRLNLSKLQPILLIP